MAVKSVDVLINARDRASNKFRRAGRATAFLSRRLTALKIAAAGAAVMIARRLLYAIGGTIKGAAEFEKQIAKVSTMLNNSTMKFLPAYRKEIAALAVEYGQTTEALTDATYDFISAQLGAQNAMMLTRVAAEAAVGGMTDASVATKGMVKILNSYQLSAKYATAVSDGLFAVVNKGVIRYDELAEGIGSVGAIAKAGTVQLKEMLGAVSTMTRGGLNAKETMTALANVILKIIAPSAGAAKTWKKLGIENGEVALKTIGLVGVMDKLNEAGVNLATMRELFPKKSIVGALTLRNDMKGLREDIIKVQNSAGESGIAFRKMAATSHAALQRAKESFKAFGRDIGDVLIPPLLRLTEYLKTSINGIKAWVRSYSAELTAFFSGLWEVTKAYWIMMYNVIKVSIQAIQSILESLGVDFDGTADTIKVVSDFIANSIKAMSIGIISAITLVEVAFVGWKDSLSLILNGFLLGVVTLWENIKHWFTFGASVVSASVTNWTNSFDAMLANLKSFAVNVGTNLANLGKSILNWVKGKGWKFEWTGLFSGMTDTMKELPDVAERQMTKLEKSLLDKVSKSGKKLADEYKNKLFPRLAPFFAPPKEAVEKAARKALPVFKLPELDFGKLPAVEDGKKKETLAEKKRVEIQPQRGVQAFTARFLKRAPGASPQEEQAKNSKASLKVQKKTLDETKKLVDAIKEMILNGAQLVYANVGG